MAKQIIILDQSPSDAGNINLRVVFWVAQSTPYPNPLITTSAYSKASSDEIVQLQKGSTIEFVKGFNFPITTPRETIKQLLSSAYDALVASLPAKAQFFDTYFDSFDGWHDK